MRIKENWNLRFDEDWHIVTWVNSCWRFPLKKYFNPFKTFILELLLTWHFCSMSLQNIVWTATGRSWHPGDINADFWSKYSGWSHISSSPTGKKEGGHGDRRRPQSNGQEAQDKLMKVTGVQQVPFLGRELNSSLSGKLVILWCVLSESQLRTHECPCCLLLLGCCFACTVEDISSAAQGTTASLQS